MPAPTDFHPRFTLAADGTSLAWESRGHGLPIIFTNGYATSHFYWDLLRNHLDDRYRTIVWDLKGHGRSGPTKDLAQAGIPHCADDLLRVLDAAQVDRAVLAGFSLGCQIIFEAWRQAPDRILGLMPFLGTYGRPFDNLFHPKIGRAAFSIFEKAAPPLADKALAFAFHASNTPLSHRLNRWSGVVANHLERDLMQPFYNHFEAIDGATWAQMGILAQQHTAEDVLATIHVPTLIIAGGRDIFTPERLSRHMHHQIPGSQLVFLPHATHAGLLEYPQEIAHAVDDFLETNFP